ncbi:MAG: patatin-like phospholipase family protein [Mycobacteriales bacterium]
MPPRRRSSAPRVAFVLGGGGHAGAHEVGMLQALLEADVRPELVVGTSIGAVNGAAVAADPTLDTVARLRELWLELDEDRIFGGSFLTGAARLVRSRTHLHTNVAMRGLLTDLLPGTFADLAVPFQCVAACIERAAEHWFHDGPLADAILASAAVPGVLPPVEIGGEHFLDGGLVNSIPISRAIELGATEIYVLQVGRVERPLTPPRTPLQVALVTFEIARRHRFARDLAGLPKGVTAHVLPTGQPVRPARGALAEMNYRNFRDVSRRIDRAHRASSEYLAALPHPGSGSA